MENHNRKFIYVEQVFKKMNCAFINAITSVCKVNEPYHSQAFFQRWWREQTWETRAKVYELVGRGQLEFMFVFSWSPNLKNHCVKPATCVNCTETGDGACMTRQHRHLLTWLTRRLWATGTSRTSLERCQESPGKLTPLDIRPYKDTSYPLRFVLELTVPCKVEIWLTLLRASFLL